MNGSCREGRLSNFAKVECPQRAASDATVWTDHVGCRDAENGGSAPKLANAALCIDD